MRDYNLPSSINFSYFLITAQFYFSFIFLWMWWCLCLALCCRWNDLGRWLNMIINDWHGSSGCDTCHTDNFAFIFRYHWLFSITTLIIFLCIFYSCGDCCSLCCCWSSKLNWWFYTLLSICIRSCNLFCCYCCKHSIGRLQFGWCWLFTKRGWTIIACDTLTGFCTRNSQLEAFAIAFTTPRAFASAPFSML